MPLKEANSTKPSLKLIKKQEEVIKAIKKLKIDPNKNLLSELINSEEELEGLQGLLLKNNDEENVNEVKKIRRFKKRFRLKKIFNRFY